MANGFVSVVKKNSRSALCLDIPEKISNALGLKPFMAGRIEAKKGRIIISGFEKTVKVKIGLDRKTIARAKKIMLLEGYGSLDETISTVIGRVLGMNRKAKTSIAYIYPGDFLQGKHWLISEYEKAP